MEKELSPVILPVHFVWKAPGPYGYRWVEARAADDITERANIPYMWFLVEDERNTEENLYDPLDDQSFTKFMTLKSRDEIAEFTKLCGSLGIGQMIVTGDGRGNRGEPFSAWAKEIRHMRLMNDLHVSLETRNESILRDYVRWNEAETAVTVRIAMGSGVTVWRKSRAILDRFRSLERYLKPGDHIGPAKLFLVEQLNEKMRERVAPCLLLNRKGEMESYLRPTNLLGALWLQLYNAIAGLSTMQRCLSCMGWIDVEKHARKVMCDRCVNNRKTYGRRYRERIEKIAMELQRKGLSSEGRKCLTAQRKKWETKLTALQAVGRP